MIPMTFGDIPSEDLFHALYQAYLGEDYYEIGHGTSIKNGEDHPFVMGGSFTATSLYQCICKAVEMFHQDKSNMDDENSAINIASSVLYTLRFEWI